jgi:hypothetical protein
VAVGPAAGIVGSRRRPAADAPVPAAGGSQLELVHVLAAMALAHIHL